MDRRTDGRLDWLSISFPFFSFSFFFSSLHFFSRTVLPGPQRPGCHVLTSLYRKRADQILPRRQKQREPVGESRKSLAAGWSGHSTVRGRLLSGVRQMGWSFLCCVGIDSTPVVCRERRIVRGDEGDVSGTNALA